DEFQDVMVKNLMGIFNKYAPFLKKVAFWALKKKGRDNARTPMQWNDKENAGFTTGTPWLPINPNYKEINVEQAMKDKNSIFHFYKKLIAFRRGNPLIIHGTFKENYASSNDIYCYERWYKGERLMVICNFKNKEIPFKLPSDCVYKSADLVLHNYDYDRKLEDMTLRPYEALVFKMI
ncbi:MAG: hypothetical protein WBM21_02375, partial [Christensenellales bacterium]